MSFLRLDNTGSPQVAPALHPWKSVLLDAECGGQWVVAGDVDGDGEAEIISAQNVNDGDIHYTSAVAAQRLDGSLLWRWGAPNLGRRTWHHDVACQIHDWDGDGCQEVILCAQGELVELDGATGRERRRFSIPKAATDCLVFCDLSGKGRPSDVLVKDRYWNIYAYNQQGDLLWQVNEPGGYKTAHQPLVVDIDNDGRDEVMAGYAMLNPDGAVRWVYSSEVVDIGRGHLDCCRVYRPGTKPADVQLVMTCCGANAIVMLSGDGQVIWEITGEHFESVDVGRVLPGSTDPQLVVDIDHVADAGPVYVFSGEGEHLGRLMTDYARHHVLLDWDGDGLDEIFIGDSCGIYSGQGERIVTLQLPTEGFPDEQPHERALVAANMVGHSRGDVVVTSPHAAHVFRNEKGSADVTFTALGSERNFTLY
jgi:outer membrane protein assembly factor BamB